MKGLMIWFAMVCYAMLLDFKKKHLRVQKNSKNV